jgi:hypothetical protein
MSKSKNRDAFLTAGIMLGAVSVLTLHNFDSMLYRLIGPFTILWCLFVIKALYDEDSK